MVVMMVMIMCGHKFSTAITAFGLNRVSALASSMANILTPSELRNARLNRGAAPSTPRAAETVGFAAALGFVDFHETCKQ